MDDASRIVVLKGAIRYAERENKRLRAELAHQTEMADVAHKTAVQMREEAERLRAEVAAKHYALTHAECEVACLRSARIAYASEFPMNSDGEPDVGSIHQNIRTLKAERDRLRAEVAALQDQRREAHSDLADLAMLVRRLALALRKAQPEHSTVSDAAIEFLRKRGLGGEVLR